MTQHPIRVISLEELKTLVPFSRSHLWRLEKAGEFPRRIRLGKRRVGWHLSDIEQWIESRRRTGSSDVGGSRNG